MPLLELANTNGCVASLNYNTTTLTAFDVVVDNTAGAVPVTFYIKALINQSVTVQPGQSANIVFPTALSVTLSPRAGALIITGLKSHGIGTGAGIGT